MQTPAQYTGRFEKKKKKNPLTHRLERRAAIRSVEQACRSGHGKASGESGREKARVRAARQLKPRQRYQPGRTTLCNGSIFVFSKEQSRRMIGTMIGSQLAVSKHVGRAVTSHVTCLFNKSIVSRTMANDTCLGGCRVQGYPVM